MLGHVVWLVWLVCLVCYFLLDCGFVFIVCFLYFTYCNNLNLKISGARYIEVMLGHVVWLVFDQVSGCHTTTCMSIKLPLGLYVY